MRKFMSGVNTLLFMFCFALTVATLVNIIHAGITGQVLSSFVYEILLGAIVCGVYSLLNAVSIEW